MVSSDVLGGQLVVFVDFPVELLVQYCHTFVWDVGDGRVVRFQ